MKAGGDIVTAGTNLYALKGNKCNELWLYVPGAFLYDESPQRDGVAASSSVVHRASFTVSPSPLASGFADVRFTAPVSSPVRCASSMPPGSGYSSVGLPGFALPADLRSMPAGVYLVKLSSEGCEMSQ